jgi:L-amino acid N-acyltransferase YncA
MINRTLIRPVQQEDAASILRIYEPYIKSTSITFENEVPDEETFRQRILTYSNRFPWLVCFVEGMMAGYAYASPHRDRAAYQWSCECSIYLHPAFQAKGIGRVLYNVLFELLTLQGLRNVYAGITLPNAASVALHERCGFKPLAVYENIGYKMGQWHSVGWWHRQLNSYDASPVPPVYFANLRADRWKQVCEDAEKKLSTVG